MLNGLDLFSGIGGLTIALSPWVRPVAYCESDRYAQSVLLSRMASGDLPHAPIWDDVRTLPSEAIPQLDIIYGGFPCQDLSVAGTGKGLGGSRSGLFFEIVRLARELRPRFLFLENVPALAVRGLDQVLLELTALGFDSRWTIVSAAEMGAPHLRERLWILAHARSERVRVIEQWNARRSDGVQTQGEAEPFDDGAQNSDAQGVGWREGRPESEPSWRAKSCGASGAYADPVLAGRKRWIDAESAWQAFALGGGGGGGGGIWPSWFTSTRDSSR